MKIAIVCQNYPPASEEGGISHYSRCLAQGLASRGHEVWAITSTEFTESVEGTRSEDGVRVIRVSSPWNHRTVFEMRDLAAEAKLNALMLQYSPASFGRSFRAAWALARIPCRKITAFHTLWGDHIDRILAILTLAGSSKIIATNSEIMTLLEKYLPVFLRKTYWIPIGSNILPNPIPDYPVQPSIPIVSHFGMVYPGKGLDTALDVLQGLRKSGSQFHFKFIGGTKLDLEGREAAFRKRLATSGLGHLAEHLGLVPAKEVSAWLRRSRFVFLPYDSGVSDRRGSLMAALAHGKAILTSPPAVRIPFLKNGINVLWPPEASVPGYLRCFERLLADDFLVHSLEEGASRLAGQFTWERIAWEHELVLDLEP
ncbi:MAG: glycosyltransferase family 4 protein [Thermodesulfobacteriota bacterium]